MKKIIAISLVAILAVGSVFAAFSGSASVGFGANFDNGNYGFIDQGTNLNFNIDLASASAEAQAEGDVYASIKASLSMFLLTGKDGIEGYDDSILGGTVSNGSVSGTVTDINTDNPKFNGTVTGLTFGSLLNGSNVGIALVASIDEAKIAGENWYVSILGAPDGNDFAKSSIDTWSGANSDKYGLKRANSTKNASYAVGYTKAPGVEVGVYDYTVGFGFKADAERTPKVNLFNEYELSLFAKTPEYDFDGFKLQVGSSYSLVKDTTNAFGVSAKLGYATDTVSVTAASDLGYDFKANKFGADIAANVAYADVVTVDAYYATTAKVNADTFNNLLSAKVVTDLNGFDVPVKLTVTAKNLVHKQDVSGEVEFTVANVTLTPSVGYVFADKAFSTGIEASYAHDAFTVKGAFSAETTTFKKETTTLKASASVETTTLVPGATLSLAWQNAEDLLNNSNDHNKNFGQVVASVGIEF